MVSPLIVALLSLLPGFEGRYAILAGIAMGVDPWLTFILATFGIILLSAVLPSIINNLEIFAEALLKSSKILKFYKSYRDKIRARVKRYVDIWGFFGLALFVTIPLPATGVWTGSIAAHLLGMEKFRAKLALMLGGVLSNSLVFLSVLLGENIIKTL